MAETTETTETTETAVTAVAVIDPKEFGLQAKDAETISSAFAQIKTDFGEIQTEYARIIALPIDDEAAKFAHELAKKVKRTNGDLTDIHKAEKNFFLQGGRFVDAWKNKYSKTLNSIRDRMIEIQKYKEKIEAERIEKLQTERVKMIAPYIDDPETRNLGVMDDDIWELFYNGKKDAFEAKKAEEEKAELDRINAEKLLKLHLSRKDVLIPYWDFLNPGVGEMNFGSMSDEAFQTLHAGAMGQKKIADDKNAKIAAENERLKIESEAKEKALAIVNKKASIRQSMFSSVGKTISFDKCKGISGEKFSSNYKAFKKIHIEALEVANKKAAADKKALEEAEKIKIKLKNQEKEKKLAIENKEKSRQKELTKCDKQKLIDLGSDIQAIIDNPKYKFKSKKNVEMFENLVRYHLVKAKSITMGV